jgi:peptidoglycan/LPS O-acetylase OafA/YrhL
VTPPIAASASIATEPARREARSGVFSRRAVFGTGRLIPGLDGVRAIAVCLVLLSHATGTRNFDGLPEFLSFGGLGVRIFFVLSGFLITRILLKEIRAEGGIDLLRFYYRRAMRLLPASYCYIAVVLVLARLHVVPLHPNDALFAIAYAMNWHEPHAWTLGHLWSLAAEEQFYFVWPFLLSIAGPRRALRCLGLVVLFAPAVRYWSPELGILGTDTSFLRIADALATGCLLCAWSDRLEAWGLYRSLLRSRIFALVPLGILVLNHVPQAGVIWAFAETALNVSIAAAIHWAILSEETLVGRWLNSRPMVAIGVLSYSLYLWQQLFMNRYSSAARNAFPQNLAFTIAASVLSFVLIERPLLQLRGRLEPRLFPQEEVAAS